MSLLIEAGVDYIHHYAPLHYLPFIARYRALLGKPSLAREGFLANHLRSKSYQQDLKRGFGNYAFLTIDKTPPILDAKLAAGFPHIGISVPSEALDQCDYDLCRYNVAMTRYLKRGDKQGPKESPSNGRYYDAHQIPVARTASDKRAMLNAYWGKSMIEVLVHGDLNLPDGTVVNVYRNADAALAEEVLGRTETPWKIELNAPPTAYGDVRGYTEQVGDFIKQSLHDPAWRGNGLEFDRV